MESHIHGACVAVPDFNALLTAPKPRYWFGDRVELEGHQGIVRGMTYEYFEDLDPYEYDLVCTGWWYAVRFDDPTVNHVKHGMGWSEDVIHPVDSRHDKHGKVIHRHAYCTTP